MSRYYSGGRTGFRRKKSGEDVDPMSSMGNMGDVMLVLACGLMVALVVAWNVDLAKFQQVEMNQELKENDIEQITEQLYGEGGAFVEKGRVYQDPTTGKYYLVEDVASSDSGSGSSTESGASDSAGGK